MLVFKLLPVVVQFISRTVGMHRKVLYDIINRVPLTHDQHEMHKRAAIESTTRVGPANPRYRHDNVSSIRGYKAVRPPAWYTGYVSRGFVREHILLMCEKFGWTELPKGYEVHHKDGNKLNNSLDNLVVLTKSEHSRIHSLEGKKWKY